MARHACASHPCRHGRHRDLGPCLHCVRTNKFELHLADNLLKELRRSGGGIQKSGSDGDSIPLLAQLTASQQTRPPSDFVSRLSQESRLQVVHQAHRDVPSAVRKAGEAIYPPSAPRRSLRKIVMHADLAMVHATRCISIAQPFFFVPCAQPPPKGRNIVILAHDSAPLPRVFCSCMHANMWVRSSGSYQAPKPMAPVIHPAVRQALPPCLLYMLDATPEFSRPALHVAARAWLSVECACKCTSACLQGSLIGSTQLGLVSLWMITLRRCQLMMPVCGCIALEMLLYMHNA